MPAAICILKGDDMGKVKSILKRIITFEIEETLAVVLLGLMFISMFLQIASRLVGAPLPFTEELSRYIYIWMTFIGLSYVIYKKLNIHIGLLVDRLPGKLSSAVRLLLEFLELCMLLFLTYWGIQFCIFARGKLSPAMEIPMLVVYVSLPISFFLAALRRFQVMIGSRLPERK